MSNQAADNYEKIVLGVAVLAAAAFGFFGFKKASAVEEDFVPARMARENPDASVKDAAKGSASRASLEADRVVVRLARAGEIETGNARAWRAQHLEHICSLQRTAARFWELRAHLDAELRLVPRSPQEHHEALRDAARELGAVVLLDE